ncbi:hypothetical protein WJX73_000710 [Symbiochloris irregularis]|uniref:P-type ATPase A domain-containing protein n=1 Tax=Symbiochloris irregularis TaxID=706552 RepID=A0AAW1P9A7_9CHLO
MGLKGQLGLTSVPFWLSSRASATCNLGNHMQVFTPLQASNKPSTRLHQPANATCAACHAHRPIRRVTCPTKGLLPTRIGRATLLVCQHGQCGCSKVQWLAPSESGESGDERPYDERNPLHRALLLFLRPTGLLQLFDLLDDQLWVAAVVFTLGCAAGAAQALAALQRIGFEHAYRIAVAATWVTYTLSGLPMLVELLFSLTAGHVDTHVLMSLAVLGTLSMGHAGEGALLLALFTISHTLEHVLTERAQGDLSSLFDQVPSHATLVPMRRDNTPDFGKEYTALTSEVELGAHMLVRPGEQVPLDGVVEHGRSLVSMEHITGESLPSARGLGDELPAGARNHDGALVLRAVRASADSTPARIARLTLAAQGSRPRLGQWLDDFGGIYSKAVLAVTAAMLLLLPLAGVPMFDTALQRGAFYRAMGVLTVASPCALVVVPSAYIAAIACISFRGMLVKGGRVLDALTQCSTVAFDKTGTLTRGQLVCTGMLTLDAQPFSPPTHAHGANATAWAQQVAESGSEDDTAALGAAMALSLRSRHPVSESLVSLRSIPACSELTLPDVEEFRLQAGAGVQGTVQRGHRPCTAMFGSAEYVCQGLSEAQALRVAAAAGRLSHSGAVSVLTISPTQSNGSQQTSEQPPLIRFFTFSDVVHAHSLAAVDALQSGRWHLHPRKRHQLNVVMLTGDTDANAQRIAQATGITRVSAGLSPEQKLQAIKDARDEAGSSRRGPGVIMVGDGINDTPALAAADVGVAVTAAMSDGAAAAADVLLLRGDGIAGLPLLLNVAQRTQAVLRQNVALAVGSIAVLALPMLLGALPLWVAVACHEGSTLLVVLNSLRLLRAPAYTASLEDHTSGSDGAAVAVENGFPAAPSAHLIDTPTAGNGNGNGNGNGKVKPSFDVAVTAS